MNQTTHPSSTQDYINFTDVEGYLREKKIFKKQPDNEEQRDIPESRLGTVEEAVQLFAGKKNILIITGAGISAASGIPTFNGVGAAPLFQKHGVEYKNESILTMKFLREHPEIFWDYLIGINKGMKGKEENISHTKIQELINFYKNKRPSVEGEQQGRVTLVTMNIDGLHVRAHNALNPTEAGYHDPFSSDYGKSTDIFEIHGDVRYIYCFNQKCSLFQKLHRFPEQFETYKDLICPECNQQNRPHTICYDETYDGPFSRMDKINESTRGRDLIIIVGTRLETEYCCWIVEDAVKKNIPVIEISLTPSVEVGGFTLKEKAQDVIPPIVDQVIQMLS